MSNNPFDPSLFRDSAISPETRAFNEQMAAQMKGRPKPWETQDGAAPSRMFAAPQSPRARTMVAEVKGRPPVELHVVAPDNPRGVYMHIHGGGLIMGSSRDQDPMLERIMNATGLACASVEYRLAPQHPYPEGWDDCETAALWLAKNAKAEFGSDWLSIGGESAGATLSVPTLTRMRDKHGFTGFRAANLSYGNFDSTMTPSQHWIGGSSFFLESRDIQYCTSQYAPDPATRRSPDMSALYANLKDMPPALFTVGTMDAFLDDSLFVYARWIAAGNEAELAVYPGGIHGFTMFPYTLATEANARIDAFLKAERDRAGR
ncbi:MAG TPA: alpha/beta hydrolase fold domain-containing protein [Rhizomicrobium sp.]|nr:alpha/beta hydrolase fold domain-containing protein [Rhizomicrobium sp.]